MSEVTLEEMEAAAKAEEPAKPTPSLAELKLEAADVPDVFKGKSAADLVEENRRLAESLKLSEDARTALARSGTAVRDVREEVVEDPADKITREELEELFKSDPMKAMEIYDRRLFKNLDKHLERRLKGLQDGAVSTAERVIKDEYKLEFELFGDQIEALKKQVQPEILTTRKGWEDMMAYIRGKPQNFEKIIARHNGKPKERAREEEVVSSGFTSRSAARPSAPVGPDDAGLDSVQLKIAETMGMSPSDYKKWAMVE